MDFKQTGGQTPRSSPTVIKLSPTPSPPPGSVQRPIKLSPSPSPPPGSLRQPIKLSPTPSPPPPSPPEPVRSASTPSPPPQTLPDRMSWSPTPDPPPQASSRRRSLRRPNLGSEPADGGSQPGQLTAELYHAWKQLPARERSARYPHDFVSRGRPTAQLMREFRLFEEHQPADEDEEVASTTPERSDRTTTRRPSPRVVIMARPKSDGVVGEQGAADEETSVGSSKHDEQEALIEELRRKVEEQGEQMQDLRKQVRLQHQMLLDVCEKVEETRESLCPTLEEMERVVAEAATTESLKEDLRAIRDILASGWVRR